MKYIIVIGDGMADNPVPELDGQTPLERANIPVIDALAAAGTTGRVRTVPQGVEPGSDTAILSIFGYDPTRYYSGRSPLEAAGAGVPLQEGDVSYRCNMVALEQGDKPYAEKVILSHNGGSVEGDDALALMEELLTNPRFAQLAAKNRVQFFPSPSFRHMAVQKGGHLQGFSVAPPHDHLGSVIGPLVPHGNEGARGLAEMMAVAHEILSASPVNRRRAEAGKLPANGIWFWAQGTAIALPNFAQAHGKKGFVVSAVPLVQGIGALGGLDFVTVEGATGELHTDYEGKTDAVLNGLAHGYDFALLHVEAPDECTHNGDIPGKIQAIEWLDQRVVERLTDGLAAAGQPYRLLILSDHKTLTSTRGHDADPVPFVLYDSRKKEKGSAQAYTEAECAKGLFIDKGHTLIARLFEEEPVS